MAQADTLAYWNAMQPRRDSVPVVAGDGGRVVSCAMPKGVGDFSYAQFCPPAWLELSAAPSAASVQQCFASNYFAWCQGYLNDALRNAPGAGASAELRVVWTLDVWFHVSCALFALNVNWSAAAADIFEVDGITGLATPFVPYEGRAVPPYIYSGTGFFDGSSKLAWKSTVSATVLQLANVGWQQLSNLGLALSSAVSSAQKGSRDPASYANATVRLPAFMTLPVFWVGDEFSRTTTSQNPLWPVLLSAMQPWSSSWSTNWLQSKGNKDAADLSKYAGDAPLTTAVYQWRLFSARDFANASIGEPLLSQYIARVASEPQDATWAFSLPEARATHAWSQSIVTGYARLVASWDYALVMSAMFGEFVSRHAPRMNPDGSLMTLDQLHRALGQPLELKAGRGAELADQWITPSDLQLIWKQGAKAATQLAQAKVVLGFDDPHACDGLTGQSLKWCQQGQDMSRKLNDAYQYIPIAGQLWSGMKLFGVWLVGFVGAAIGAIHFPFRALPCPVARTLTTAGWSFAPTGGTLDIWSRWITVAGSYESALPGLFTARSAAAAGPRKNCVTKPTPLAEFCTICDDGTTSPPGCDGSAPAASAQDASAVAAMNTLAASQQAQCRALAVAWIAAHPEYKDCLTAADLPAWDVICLSMLAGQRTPEAANAAWMQYVTQVKKCKPSALRAFGQALVQGTNPLRGRVESPALLRRLAVPINPARWWTGG